MSDSVDKCLIITDIDLPVVASVFALINHSGELVVEYRLEDDNEPRRNSTKRATVDRDDTLTMARRLHISVEELPARLNEECGTASDGTPSEVEYIFGEALNYIIEAGVQYRLKEINS